MRKITKKQMLIFIIVSIVLLGIGFIGGFYTKILIDEDQLIKEKEKQTSLSALISESEITKLREKIEKDEADYGDNYQEFKTYNPYVYKKEPDRIYFKSSKIGAFYVFEKEDKNKRNKGIINKKAKHITVSEFDENYNKDIIFKFLENTRLYRLITYLSYYKEPILKSDLPKKEFANNTSMSGYLYMTYIDGN